MIIQKQNSRFYGQDELSPYRLETFHTGKKQMGITSNLLSLNFCSNKKKLFLLGQWIGGIEQRQLILPMKASSQ